MRKIIPLILIIAVTTVLLVSVISYATALTTSVDSSNRRQYVYCPFDPTLFSSKTTFEISGCPLARIYVDNWNSLSPTDQTTIDTQLRNNGFKDIGEVSPLIK